MLGAYAGEHTAMDRYAQELAAALRAADPRPIALVQPVRPRLLSRLADRQLAYRIDSAWSRYVLYPWSIRGRRAEVFHVLDHGYAQLCASLDPARTVVTCHDIIPLLAWEGLLPMQVPATVRWTFRRRLDYLATVRAVIAVSAATRDTLLRHTAVPRDRIVVIPHGVNPGFRPLPDAPSSARRAVGLPPRARVLLHVATPGRYKNTPVLLHAFADLRRRVPDALLARVGAPLYDDEAALAEALGIAGAIRRVDGPLDNGALAVWYNAADVLVFPSLWEGFGWPPLEAMASGTPVVASAIPAMCEVVGEAGLLVPATDPSALAQAVERVLTDAALAASMREKGLARARAFTWARAAERTLAVYDMLTG